MKGTLFIDVDGVIAGSHSLMIHFLREEGHDVSLDDVTSWSWGRLKEKTGLSTKECVDYIHGVWSRAPERIQPLDDAVVSVVNYLLATYDAEIVTANPVPAVEPWLALQGINTDYFRRDAVKNGEYTVYIEDNPALEVNGHVLLLRDQPWNRDKDAPRFYHSSELPGLVACYRHLLKPRIE